MKVFFLCLLLLLIILFIASLIAFRMAAIRIKNFKKSKKSMARAYEADRLFGETIKREREYLRSLPYEEWKITSFDKLNLYGKFYKNENCKKTIILFHGFRSNGEHDFSCAFQMYFERGSNILIPDQRAHGKSGGSFIGYGVLERYDVLSWVNKVLEECGNGEEIYLSGVSMGGATVLMAAGLNLPSNVKAIVADSSFTSPKEIIRKVMSEDMKVPSFPLLYTTILLAKLWAHYDFNYSTFDALKNCKIPVMFIHGKKDDFVPFSMGIENYQACPTEKCAFWAEEAGHGTSFLFEREKCVKALEEFLNLKKI